MPDVRDLKGTQTPTTAWRSAGVTNVRREREVGYRRLFQ
jgi:hypothetical protein